MVVVVGVEGGGVYSTSAALHTKQKTPPLPTQTVKV